MFRLRNGDSSRDEEKLSVSLLKQASLYTVTFFRAAGRGIF